MALALSSGPASGHHYTTTSGRARPVRLSVVASQRTQVNKMRGLAWRLYTFLTRGLLLQVLATNMELTMNIFWLKSPS